MDRKVMILVGSPKEKCSTSHALSKYLSDELNHLDIESNIFFLSQSKNVIDSIESYKYLIIACPLYCDNLPSGVLELMSQLYQRKEIISNINLMLIINAGFPESNHNNVAIKTAKNFAEKMKFNWLGSLSIGEGGIISGQNLNEIKLTKKIRKALKIVASDIKNGNTISQSAMKLAKEKMAPYPIYYWVVKQYFKKRSKQLGSKSMLKNTPYK